MERYTMFVNWNNQYCPNEHYPRKCTDLMPSSSNYQRHFFFTDYNKKLKIFKETQKTLIDKAILRKKNSSGGIRFPDFRL